MPNTPSNSKILDLDLIDPDETISSRVGKIRRRCGGIIPWSKPIPKIINAICEPFDEDHTLDAIEEDEGSKEVKMETSSVIIFVTVLVAVIIFLIKNLRS